MKLDKETFAKHNFWFLLLFAVPLALLAILWLMTVVPSGIAAERKKLENMITNAKGASPTGYKRPSEIELKKREADLKEKEKEKIWAAAYNREKDIFTMPASLDERFQNGLFALAVKASEKRLDSVPEDDKNHFNGKIKGRGADWLTVVGAKGVTKKFYKTKYTEKVEVKTEDAGNATGFKKSFFRDLKEGYQVAVTFEKGKYFGDALTKEEQELFRRRTFDDGEDRHVGGYTDQIAGILKMVNPVNAQGKGTVILRNWPVPDEKTLPPRDATFFHFAANEWQMGDFDEVDVWTAQEDLWIQREIFRIIAEANREISVFKLTKSDPKSKTYHFENPYWAIKIKQISDTKLDLYLANLMNRWQRLGIKFKITTDYKDKDRKEPIVQTVTALGSLIKPYQKRPTGYSYDKFSITLEKSAKGIFGVEQDLSWKLAAVKRIDQIQIGAHSHRTAGDTLVAFKSKDEKKPPPADPNNQFGQPPGQPLGVVAPGVMPPGVQPGQVGDGQNPFGAKGEDAKDMYTKMGLLKKRYLKVSDQSRRVPVGVSLIVDQRHMELVTTAFRNSKLRFLTTQMVMHQYPYELSPTTAANPLPANPGGVNPQNPEFDPMNNPGIVPPGQPPPGIVPPGVFPPGIAPPGMNPMPEAGNDIGNPNFPFQGVGKAPRSYSFSDEQDPNVELVIYGIISLYQRFPPRDEKLLPAQPTDNQAPPPAFGGF